MPARQLICAAVVASLAATLLTAAAPPARPTASSSKESFSEAGGSVTIAGKKIEYATTAGRLPVKDRTGKASAHVFFMAYVKKGVTKPASRPITFCFNGGPGSSSMWLHLGAFGPRRVVTSEDGRTAPQPAKLVENEWSILDLTDLVFIDPVSTGYSRADDPKDAKLFHGVEEDVSSVGEFIRSYAAKYGRTGSPTYVAGESYGGTRAAGLTTYLQDKGMKLTGVLMVSPVMNFGTIRFDEGNDLPHTLFLPTYTATAWYHKRLDRTLSGDLSAAVKEAETFAEGEYAQALRKGNRLGDEERQAIAKKASRLTGLSEDFMLKADLRVDALRFRRELLRDKAEMTGRYDARVVGSTRGGGGKGDPSYAALQPAYAAAVFNYLSDGLKYRSPLRYQASQAPVQPWNYGEAGNNRYVNVAPRLRTVMQKNASLRVFVACGYYDLATPFAATQYTFAHLGPRSLTDRVTLCQYEGGHMMYSNHSAHKKLRGDVAKFYDGVRPDARAE